MEGGIAAPKGGEAESLTERGLTRRMKRWLVGMLAIGFVCAAAMAAEEPTPAAGEETPQQHNARMQWWREAKFGLFIHWGVYAVLAGAYQGKQIPGLGEWIMHEAHIPLAEYRQVARQFNPVKYDPDAWVRLAKEAGMKYIVITAKHHDGFALFDSKATDFDAVDATAWGKDLLKPLADACRKHGIRLGFYYSQAQDWNHPGGEAPDPVCSVVVLRIAGAPNVLHQDVRQAPDGSVVLEAFDAVIHDARGTGPRYEAGGGNIGYWYAPQAWLEWRFKVLRPGTFEASAMVASPSEGVRLQVAAGGREITVAVPQTGNFGRYQRVKIGRNTLGESGLQSLRVRPVAKGWHAINLRSVTLKMVP